MTDEALRYVKTNHVITAKTNGRRDLQKTYNDLQFGVYSPKTFSALILKFKNPSTTILLFSTGSLTIMGCSSVWGARYVMHKLKRRLGIQFVCISLTNIVFNMKFNALNIDKLYNSEQGSCMCNMELFPSCTYTVPDTNIKANFFSSGKVVVTGCQSDQDVEETSVKLIDFIRTFREK